MRRAPFALVLALATVIPVRAQTPPPTVPELLAAEAEAARGCAGTGDPAIVRGQCTLRDRLGGRLAQAGYCFGRKGQADEKRAWHPCGPDSVTVDDVEAVRR